MVDIKAPLDFDGAFEELGGFGRFQLFIFLTSSVCSFFSGYFVLSSIFGGKVLQHRCKIPICNTNATIYEEDFLNFTTPWNVENKAWDQCNKFPLQLTDVNQTQSSPLSNSSNFHNLLINSTSYYSSKSTVLACDPGNFNSFGSVPCSEWVFDTNEIHSTTVSEFSLTCDREWMAPLDSSTVMAGFLFGSLGIGNFSDRFGRKLGLLLSIFLLCLGGIVSSTATNFYVLLFGRLVGGMGASGTYESAFITSIEYIGTKWRTVCGIMINIPYTLGEAFLGLAAYCIRSWRYLYLACSVPAVVLLSCWWILPESTQWLITENRKEEALQTFKKIAKFNKTKLPDGFEEQLMMFTPLPASSYKLNHKSSLDLIKSPIMRRRSLTLFYCWSVCSLMYYGLSTYVGSFSGNIYINYTLVILIELPGYSFSAFASNVIGRKLVLIISYLVGGSACIIAGLLPSESITIVVLSLIGKFCITASFGAIFVFGGEIYPTEYRAIGIGTCGMFGKIGGIIAPFISSLSQFYEPLPAFIFGMMSFLAGLLIFPLPDTLGEKFPQTLQESEDIGKDQSWYTFKVFSSSEKNEVYGSTKNEVYEPIKKDVNGSTENEVQGLTKNEV